MELIQISDNVFVNPLSIDMIELKVVKNKPSIIVHIGTKTRTSDRDPVELISDIKRVTDEHLQFRRN